MTKQAKPNILIIVIDSLRADHCSCYGYHRQTTPNIDRLAAEGCLFETCITAAPFSPASYASLFSNLYPHQHGVNGDTVRVWPNTFTRLAEKMKAAGYATIGVSNNDFVSSHCNATQGFDVFIDAWQQGLLMRRYDRFVHQLRRHVGERWARRFETNSLQCSAKGDSLQSIHELQKHISYKTGQPFFGFVVLMDPHAPYRRTHQIYGNRSPQSRCFWSRFNSGRMWVETMAKGGDLDPDYLSIAMDCYDSEISFADQCVGRMYDWLEDRGLLDNTILLVTADHGEAFGEHRVWGHGFCLTDCVTRVPLVIRCPRYFAPTSRSSALIQLHDVHELCLSVSKNGNPRPQEFSCCLTQADDPSWPGREVAFSEFPVQTQTLGLFKRLNPGFKPGKWGSEMWAARIRQWRYIEFNGRGNELFDLAADPAETMNVVPAHRDIVRDLQAKLARHRNTKSPDTGFTFSEPEPDLDETVRSRLRALGYIE